MQQQLAAGTTTPATSISVGLRYTGVQRSYTYEVEIGLDTDFDMHTCTKSAAWVQKNIRDEPSADARTTYNLFTDTTSKLIDASADNVADGVNGDGYILFKDKAS